MSQHLSAEVGEKQRKMSKVRAVLRGVPFNQHLMSLILSFLMPLNIKLLSLLNSELSCVPLQSLESDAKLILYLTVSSKKDVVP